jgi:hypothetical protein
MSENLVGKHFKSSVCKVFDGILASAEVSMLKLKPNKKMADE